MNSPCAIFMIFIKPKVIAKPNAANINMELTLIPLNICKIYVSIFFTT